MRRADQLSSSTNSSKQATPVTGRSPQQQPLQPAGLQDADQILALQRTVGNQATINLLQNRTNNTLQRVPGVGDVGMPKPGGSTAVDLSESISLIVDVAGYAKNLAMVVGWSALSRALGEDDKASDHMIHNMFGEGMPLGVEKEWVMGAPNWKSAYKGLMKNWINEIVSHVKHKYIMGENSGNGEHTVSKSGISSRPDKFMGKGTDQFFGSGNAKLSVSGKFTWEQPDPTGEPGNITIKMTDIEGEFFDRYDWHRDADSGEYSRQERGWTQPFDIIGSWVEKDIEKKLELGIRAEESGGGGTLPDGIV